MLEDYVKDYSDRMRYSFRFVESEGGKVIGLKATKAGTGSAPVSLLFNLDADDCEALSVRFAEAAKALQGVE